MLSGYKSDEYTASQLKICKRRAKCTHLQSKLTEKGGIGHRRAV